MSRWDILKWFSNNYFELLRRAFAQAVRELRQQRRAPRSKKGRRYSQEQLALEAMRGIDRINLEFALGKALEDEREFAASF